VGHLLIQGSFYWDPWHSAPLNRVLTGSYCIQQSRVQPRCFLLIIRVELVEMLNKTPYTREEVCKELEITVCILPTLVFLLHYKIKACVLKLRY